MTRLKQILEELKQKTVLEREIEMIGLDREIVEDMIEVDPEVEIDHTGKELLGCLTYLFFSFTVIFI
jgi:hypothetical protein